MNARNLIGGFIAAAALGAAAGLLLAPASGEKTRKKIAKGSLKVKDNVVDYVESSMDTLRNQFNDKLEMVAKRGRDMINQGKEAVNHGSERVKP